jgi:quercetin dioxygenase-like cupin family protein
VADVSVANLSGLNTLGISLARLDFAPGSLFPPHYHLRASEMLVVMKGTLEVGFISLPNKRLFLKVLNQQFQF